MTSPSARVPQPPPSSPAAGGPGPGYPPGGSGPGGAAPGAHRQELLRALAAVVLSPPPACAAPARSLGLPVPDAAAHTAVFVLSAPPHAAIHLGPEGKLGGEGADRVAGFWRVLGLTPPPDADHLGTLLMLAAELGDAAAGAAAERTRARLTRAREALLWEHLWPWVPGYLTMAERLAVSSLAQWAGLTRRALAREARLAAPPPELPLALRAAPPALPALPADGKRDDLLDALLAPARSGLLITREDLREAAQAAGAGYRMGERRYILAALLDQDAPATLEWLSGFARRWAHWHLRAPAVAGPDPRHWWAARAGATAVTLRELRQSLVGAGPA